MKLSYLVHWEKKQKSNIFGYGTKGSCVALVYEHIIKILWKVCPYRLQEITRSKIHSHQKNTLIQKVYIQLQNKWLHTIFQMVPIFCCSHTPFPRSSLYSFLIGDSIMRTTTSYFHCCFHHYSLRFYLNRFNLYL